MARTSTGWNRSATRIPAPLPFPEARRRRKGRMEGAVLYGTGDVRLDERESPRIIHPTDAIIRLAATCVCGSDLWDYRGINPVTQPKPMGHEYCGIVEEVGGAVR